jgi:glutamyl-tRNA synthetase
LAADVAPFLAKAGLDVTPDDPKLLAAVPLVAPRATTFIDAADALDYFFREPPRMDPKAKQKFLGPDKQALLSELASVVEKLEAFEAPQLEAAVKTWLEQKAGLELKDVAQPARVALTGRSASPGLFDVMAVLGRERSLLRLRAAGV